MPAKKTATGKPVSENPITEHAIDPTKEPTPVPVHDAWGTRMLIVQPDSQPCAGTPENLAKIILEIEAATKTRLKDGENPIWFQRVLYRYKEKYTPGGASFEEFCGRVHSDKIDTKEAKGTTHPKRTLADELRVKAWHELEAECTLDGLRFKRVGAPGRGRMLTWDAMGLAGARLAQRLLIELAQSTADGIANPGTDAHRTLVCRVNERLRDAVGVSVNPIRNVGGIRTQCAFKITYGSDEVSRKAGAVPLLDTDGPCTDSYSDE